MYDDDKILRNIFKALKKEFLNAEKKTFNKKGEKNLYYSGLSDGCRTAMTILEVVSNGNKWKR